MCPRMLLPLILLLIATTSSLDNQPDNHLDNQPDNHLDRQHKDEPPAESPPEHRNKKSAQSSHGNHGSHGSHGNHGNHGSHGNQHSVPIGHKARVPKSTRNQGEAKKQKHKVIKKLIKIYNKNKQKKSQGSDKTHHGNTKKAKAVKKELVSATIKAAPTARHWIPAHSSHHPDRHALPPVPATQAPLTGKTSHSNHGNQHGNHGHQHSNQHGNQHGSKRGTIGIPEPARPSLLSSIYHAIARAMGSREQCTERKLTVFVGARSPVFGGILLSSPVAYINQFSVEGAGNTISRAEVFGCTSLPGSSKHSNSPCGPGQAALLWSWYNGQSLVRLPNSSSVQVGRNTPFTYIVTRIVKFRARPRPKLRLHKQIVNLSFKQCDTKPAFYASSYRFEISKLIQIRKYFYPKSRINLDISCRHRGPPFYVYGYTGHTGIYGNQIIAWKENSTWAQIASTTVQNKLHLLEEYVRVNTGDKLHVRCNYRRPRQLGLLPSLTPYGNIKQEVCQMHLMILIDSSLEPFAPHCETASHFSPHDPDVVPVEEKPTAVSQSRYIQVLAVFSVFMVVYFLCKVYSCRDSCTKGSTEEEEAQGLISEPVDNNIKIR